MSNLTALPSIELLLNTPHILGVIQKYSQAETVAALRELISGLRSQLLAGDAVALPDFLSKDFAETVAQNIEAARMPSLRAVINATGVIIHTNLGRAPLAPLALQAMQDVALTPSNLEFDLETGMRGSRHVHVERLICELTGAQAALVVNNCAAAVLLSLMATSTGRNVIASRGELIEIGGSYRLPDVIAQSGATLREVGTTNKTRLSDYSNAIDDTTAVLLKSHTSNFRIVGFTSAPRRQELVELAAQTGTIVIEDLGSGVLIDLSPYGLDDEPVVADIIRSGVDLVMFSGDKLLGGPQAGIIAGTKVLIEKLKSHPLMRAVRPDKTTLAALDATLRLYKAPFDPIREIPVLAMLAEPFEAVTIRAKQAAEGITKLGFTDIKVQDTTAQVGAGAMPERGLPSVAVSCRIEGISPNELAAKLRQNKIPIIGRIERGRVLLDMRTIKDADLSHIIAAFQSLKVP